MKLIIAYKTVRTYIFWLIITSIFLPICLLLALIPKTIRYDNRLYFLCTALWNKLMLFFVFVHIKVDGEENIPVFPHNPYIIVSNHTSALDIMIIDSLLKNYPRVWLAKNEYGKIPLFGKLLKQMHVLVERDNPRKAMEALINAIALVKDKDRHLVIFPEGTRSKDGKIGEFLDGFAFAASKTKRGVIPFFIENAQKVCPADSNFIDPRAATIKVRVGKPLEMLENEDRISFKNRVKEWFLEAQNT